MKNLNKKYYNSQLISDGDEVFEVSDTCYNLLVKKSAKDFYIEGINLKAKI